jgi:hypothetical protein
MHKLFLFPHTNENGISPVHVFMTAAARLKEACAKNNVVVYESTFIVENVKVILMTAYFYRK